MKNSKTRLVILILIVAAVAGIIIYPNVVNKIEQDPQEFSPAALLEEVMSHRQTTVLVFSYDAECCPGTQEFFAAYKEDVYHAMEPLLATKCNLSGSMPEWKTKRGRMRLQQLPGNTALPTCRPCW